MENVIEEYGISLLLILLGIEILSGLRLLWLAL